MRRTTPRRGIPSGADLVTRRLGLSARRGQALVEFIAVLTPLLLIVVGIVQFGLLYGTHVTLTNAAREGARAGTIYVYDYTHTAYWNDAHRCAAILAAATVLALPASAQAATCNISGKERKLGTTYVLSLTVKGVSCKTGESFVKSFHRCRGRVHPAQSSCGLDHLRGEKRRERQVHVFDGAQRVALGEDLSEIHLREFTTQVLHLGVGNAPRLHRPADENEGVHAEA